MSPNFSFLEEVVGSASVKIIIIMLWKITIALNYVSMIVVCQFDNQYLGHYLTFEEYNNLELGCDTTICLRDSQRLLLAATQNKTIEPCDDFAEFAMGQFIKLTARNDRYKQVGFYNDVKLLNREKFRKVLATRINGNDIKPFRSAKNFYQKCVTSDNVRENGTAEMLQLLRSLGGAPFLNPSWDEERFNVKELFVKVTYEVAPLFINHGIGRCPHPQNKSLEVVCLKSVVPVIRSGAEINDIVYMFKDLKIDKELIRATAEECNTFRQNQIDVSGTKEASVTLTISQINNYTNYTLDWLRIINSQLTIESQLTGDADILIEKPELLLKLLELIKVTPKG